MKINLKYKLYLAFGATLLIPLGMLGTYATLYTQDTLSTTQAVTFTDDLFIRQKQIEDQIKSFVHDVQYLADVPALDGLMRAKNNGGIDLATNSTQAQWIDRFAQGAQSLLTIKEQYKDVVYVDETGEELARIVRNDGAIEIVEFDDLAIDVQAPHIASAKDLDGDSIYISEFELSTDENGAYLEPYQAYIRGSISLWDTDGAYRGVLSVSLYAFPIFKVLPRTGDGGIGHYLISTDGYFHRHPDADQEWGHIVSERSSSTAKLLFDNKILSVIDNPDEPLQIVNQDSTYFHVPIQYDSEDDEKLWLLVKSVPNAVIASKLNAFFKIFGILIVACLGAAMALAYVVIRGINGPVLQLMGASTQMAGGNYEARVTISSGDEIGQLGEAFNNMAQDIQANTIEVSRVKNMMENAPVNVMFVDLDLVLRYMNPLSTKTLKTLEHLLPVKIDDMIGTCIDVFHKNPTHQRKLLGDPKNLPYQAQIQLGDETLDLLVSAIFDNQNTYLGAMATWEVITVKVKQEEEIKAAADREKEQQQRLQAGVSDIAQIGTNLASASEELTSVSSTMGSTAEETSSQANVVAAAAEQVRKNVESVSTGSEEMTASIQEIAKNTTDAAKVAAQAVNVAESTNATVAKLGQSSAEIGSIIKVITTIAEQTNLLALNATIEAARAGDAGKGFAVVANEVKELAKETTKATENISRMIETIQADTKGSVDAIEEISTIIKQVNDYMNTIASAVEEQTVTTNEMARNVVEASKGSSEIAGNIVSVADAARGTTEGATQTQQASAELAKMAADLQKVVATLT